MFAPEDFCILLFSLTTYTCQESTRSVRMFVSVSCRWASAGYFLLLAMRLAREKIAFLRASRIFL